MSLWAEMSIPELNEEHSIALDEYHQLQQLYRQRPSDETLRDINCTQIVIDSIEYELQQRRIINR